MTVRRCCFVEGELVIGPEVIIEGSDVERRATFMGCHVGSSDLVPYGEFWLSSPMPSPQQISGIKAHYRKIFDALQGKTK
jgi:hypothetical protein